MCLSLQQTDPIFFLALIKLKIVYHLLSGNTYSPFCCLFTTKEMLLTFLSLLSWQMFRCDQFFTSVSWNIYSSFHRVELPTRLSCSKGEKIVPLRQFYPWTDTHLFDNLNTKIVISSSRASNHKLLSFMSRTLFNPSPNLNGFRALYLFNIVYSYNNNMYNYCINHLIFIFLRFSFAPIQFI